MRDQRIMFIMGPIISGTNDLWTSDAGLRNRPLSCKGLIYMPWKVKIWTGVHPCSLR